MLRSVKENKRFYLCSLISVSYHEEFAEIKCRIRPRRSLYLVILLICAIFVLSNFRALLVLNKTKTVVSNNSHESNYASTEFLRSRNETFQSVTQEPNRSILRNFSNKSLSKSKVL